MVKNSVKTLGAGRRNQWLNKLSPSVASSDPGNGRVLIDTNVWYSAILYGGKPEAVVTLCKQQYQIISSPYLLNELFALLKELGTPYRWRNSLEKVLKRITLSVETPDFSGISRDPKDDPIISAAITGECVFLITNDKDLLELGGYQKMRIIRPSDFLQFHKLAGLRAFDAAPKDRSPSDPHKSIKELYDESITKKHVS
jgi:putative PIN family toxin of toxin-antitoxin system